VHYPAAHSEGSVYPIDQLIAGNSHLLLSRKRSVAAGQNLVRGAVLGVDRSSQTATVTVSADNTGDADLSAVAVTMGRQAKPGVYVLKCTAEDTDAGTFEVRSPDGADLGDLTVDVAFSSEHISLTIPDGAADWAVDDLVYISVADDGAVKLSAVDATDGSHEPRFILAEDCDASAGAKHAMAYTQGDFNARALTFGTGHAADLVREAMQRHGIRLISSLLSSQA
jgi:hypothetical protein